MPPARRRRSRPSALESALAAEGDGGRVAAVLGLDGLVLVGGVRDDGRGEAVEVHWTTLA